jgi:cobalt/nickel transport system permease protein
VAVHIPDGFIDLRASAAAAAVAAPAVAVATRRAGRQLAEREVPLAGLVVAYLVVAQLLVFPIGLGTGAHLLGTGLALVLVGPWVAQACVAVVLVLQALVLADGGITALGLNDLNNGLVPLLVGWGVLAVTRPVWRGPDRPGPRSVVAGLAAAAGAFAGAAAFCAEYTLGGTDALPAGVVTVGFLAAHAVVAVGEGVLTGLLVAALGRTRPDLVLRWWPDRRTRAGADAAGRRRGPRPRGGERVDDPGAAGTAPTGGRRGV